MRLFTLIFVFFAFLCDAGSEIYGSAPTLKGPALPLSSAIEKSELNKTIKLSGRVSALCKKKGCWMELVDGKATARVTFKDYGFFVPQQILNKLVIVEGALTSKALSEEEARHYAKDQGKSDEEIAAIRGPQKEFSIVAVSVLLQ